MTDTSGAAPSTQGLITMAQASKLLMVGEEWVRRLSKQGYIDRPQKGFVSLVGAVQGYIRFLKDEERRTSKTAADSRVKDMRADELSLRIEDRSRALVLEAQAEAIAVVDEVAGGLRADLMALPARVTSDIGMRRLIEDGIDEAFGAASERAARLALVSFPPGKALGSKAKSRPRSVGEGKPGVSTKRRRAGAA